MAWICVALENTLTQQDPETGEMVPINGAAEAIAQLMEEGHRITVLTSRFAPMPSARKQEEKEEIELELQTLGFPPLEVWSGTVRPNADVFVDAKGVTFDNDWPLALAQLQSMLEDQGLIQGPQPGAAERALFEQYPESTEPETEEPSNGQRRE